MENNGEVMERVQNICKVQGGKLAWMCYDLWNRLHGKKINLKEVSGALLGFLQEYPEVTQGLSNIASKVGEGGGILESTLDELDGGGQQDSVTVYSSPEEMYRESGQEKELQLLIELTTKLKLYRVENMGALLIVLYGLQLDYVQTEFSDIKQLILNEHLSKLDTGWANYHNYLHVDSQKLKQAEARQWKREYLMEAQKSWTEGINVLKRDIETSVQQVQQIASQSLLRRISKMKELDESMVRIKGCLIMLENTVPLACTVIGMNHGDAERFAREYGSFFDRVIGNNIHTLENYCVKEDYDYWEKIEKNGSQVIAGSCMSMAKVIDKL